MFFELVTADFVIVDTSVENPNVYYELGVRHTVTPRGTVMVGGGWSKPPFDLLTDRYFTYDGKLFLQSASPDADALAKAVKTLGKTLAGVFTHPDSEDSPVYALLPGLRAPDWTRLDNVRAKYFRGTLETWMHRMEAARNAGRPGDIMTLADEAPTTYHARTLKLAAANTLLAMRRYERSRRLFEELKRSPGIEPLRVDPPYALVLGRLGKQAEAQMIMTQLTSRYEGEPEAQGILGRVYKDHWRSSWRDGTSLADRRVLAMRALVRAKDAIRCYGRTLEVHPGQYYTGVNVVGLVRLVEFLAQDSGQAIPEIDLGEWADIAAVITLVEKTARAKLAAARREWGTGVYCDDLIWAEATLGEVALVSGRAEDALKHYTDALIHTRCTAFQAESMVSQLTLYSELGFQEQSIQAVMRIATETHPSVLDQIRSPWAKVILFHGHMIDEPDRATPRFPAEAVADVRNQIERQLDEWGVGPGHLALCGGACGSDILFAEACLARKATVRLMIPLPPEEFIAGSVERPTGDWVARFNALANSSELAVQPDRLGPCPEWHDKWERNVRWLNATAAAESEPGGLYALFVWDGASGDGPGGTASAYEATAAMGAERKIVTPNVGSKS
jgi:tetratricopeptide (TPR) repeat protein